MTRLLNAYVGGVTCQCLVLACLVSSLNGDSSRIVHMPLELQRHTPQEIASAAVEIQHKLTDRQTLAGLDPLQLATGTAVQRLEPVELPVKAEDFVAINKHIHDLQDQIYLVRADIGTPAQRPRLIVDTGSSDLWIKDVYDFRKSSTAQEVQDSHTTLEYGKGEVVGHQIRDTVCLGSLCLKNQSMLAATKVRYIGNDQFYDGLIGLANPGLFVEKGGQSFLANYVINSGFDNPGFAMNLDHVEGKSFIAFGSVSDLEAEAESRGLGKGYSLPLYSVSNVATYWLVSATFSVTDTFPKAVEELDEAAGMIPPLRLEIAPSPIFTVFDSGSSLIVLPSNMYARVRLAVLSDNIDKRLCDGTNCLCTVHINPMVFEFSTREGDVLRIELKRDDLFTLIGFNQMRQGICRFNVMDGGPRFAMPFWNLGDVMFRHIYAIHDPKKAMLELFDRSNESANRPHSNGLASQIPNETEFSNMPSLAIVLVGMLFSMTVLLQRRRHSSSHDDLTAYGQLAA